jgi:4a-hydroxytetrahydrobiopterin dehydratase
MEKLAQDVVEQRLAELPEWSRSGDSIQRTLSFENFAGAMEFVNRIAELAEAQQHHPDIMIRYNKVTLTLSTHDAGGITERDFALAREADASYSAAT